MDMANDERMKELMAFDNTKLGVKGLVDAKVVNLPKMFIRPAEELAEDLARPKSQAVIPIIDLDGLLTDDRRREIVVDQVRIASENWGFFQVVNHGIPVGVLDNLMAGIRKFNEQDIEAKKEFYSRDHARRVKFNSNYDLFESKTVSWRDSLIITMLTSDPLDPTELPSACRDESIDYINHVTELGNKIFDLLSEALRLKPDHLRSTMQCNEARSLGCHYYPECPEPELAIGITQHTDSSFLTIVAQDQTGGLQVLHENKNWADVKPIPGALVVNIGDLLQLVSNDKLKSVVHRVLPSRQTRVSAAFFFAGRVAPPAILYGPIKELTSEENPAKYRGILVSEYLAKFRTKGLHEKPCLDQYRL
ncbi:Oxoglutarate/iron-dependent dioxygenase [Parasponia andersonii]|uniref:Oxoglutarate/iron-dependent dioxygenase n=1 Tax=Parasponia andersonii TaxID=3476 RepID=A0A2P5CSS6_PARAD|nr:Oxoglutarate/iron-dependent dioxygenase [Parasponia andersonii]